VGGDGAGALHLKGAAKGQTNGWRALVSDSDRVAGESRLPASPSEGVQPAEGAGSKLGAPVPLSEVLRGIAPALAGETRRMQENLERRAADQELRDELASCDFDGRRYQKFEAELARYGMSVLRGWMYSGYVFQLAAGRGFALHPSDRELEELHRDSDVREELATMTVALALPRFREHALVRGGWRYDGGASLATYFMGACLYVFPNEFRKRRVQLKKWRLQDYGDPAVTAPQADHIADPAVLAVGNIRVCDDLSRADPRERAIVALTIDGYSQDEIVEMLGEQSVRAIEGVLYRWRTKEQGRMGEGGG
jgi:hypothetical protein